MRPATAAAMALVIAVGAALASASPARAIPQVAVTCNDGPRCGGWFTGPVSIDWTVAGHASVSGCVDRTLTAETAGTEQGCIATDSDDVEVSVTVTIRIDRSPPTVLGGIASRPPDHDGWYTAPVDVRYSGTDALSGLASCTTGRYAGADSAAAAVSGTCTDVAGNRSTPYAYALRYDATAPSTAGVGAETGDRSIQLTLPPGATASVVRSPGIRGAAETLLASTAGGTLIDRRVRNGLPYAYRVTLTDEAGNAATRTLRVVPGPRLLAPTAGQQLTAPPLLRWTAVRNARYYNVQLERDGKKVLSRWPAGPQLQLRAAWRFHGRRYHLKEGRYRWVVWPGKGPRADGRYGRRIGGRSFEIVAPPQ